MLILQICPCIVEQSNSHLKSSVVEQEAMDKAVDSIFDQDDTGNPTSPPKKTSTSIFGKVVLGVTGAVAIGLVAITTPFLTPALRKICLPYVPATEQQIINVLKMCRPLQGRTGQSLVDLGSGDGRVVRLSLLQFLSVLVMCGGGTGCAREGGGGSLEWVSRTQNSK